MADIRRGAAYDVWGKIAGDKIKLQGGKTMHNFDLFTNMVRAPKALDEAEEPDFGDLSSGESSDQASE